MLSQGLTNLWFRFSQLQSTHELEQPHAGEGRLSAIFQIDCIVAISFALRQIIRPPGNELQTKLEPSRSILETTSLGSFAVSGVKIVPVDWLLERGPRQYQFRP